MLKINLLIINFLFLIYILNIIFLNFSIVIYIECNFIIFNLYLNYVHIWFVFFMYIIFFFLYFLLSKKIVSQVKYFFIIYIYIIIFFFVSIIIIIDDFIIFMIAFESLFFPICFISLFFTFNNRFIFAIYYLIIFSSISSILCIVISIILIFHFNSINLINFIDIIFLDSLHLIIFIWLLLFIMFAIKYPMWPLHIWLPEVHVEVNTEMSALLASIVLKIGFFGIFKFIYLLFNTISIWLLGIINSLSILGILFLSLSLLFLCDYKKIIANWSVIHTCIGLILLWHNDFIFIGVLYFCNLGHICSSSFMFIFIGYMYDNYGIRIFLLLISFFGISLWSSMFLCLFLFNIDFPFMLLFYIDLFILYGLMTISFFYVICFLLIILIMFTSTIYIYISLSYFSFIWIDKYLRLDLTINDIYIYFIISNITLLLFFFIYFLF